MTNVLQFDHVSKEYDSATALRDLSFTVAPGEFTALAGPSGSGKTSILNLAAGLDDPTSGGVILLGRPLKALNPWQVTWLRRRQVGFIFQAYNLFPVLTVLENVEYPLALNEIGMRQRQKMALDALEAVGLKDLAQRRPSELSGGQQQRAAVARAIASKPKIIFADEPTANLDSENATRLIELFRRLNAERGITFLFSSHDPRILSAAKRVIRVQDGMIQGEPPHAPAPIAPHHPPLDADRPCERIV